MNTRTIAALSALTAVALGPPADERIDWRTDLAAARTEARASGSPMLVVFR